MNAKNGKSVEINITLIPIKNKVKTEVYVILHDSSEFQNQKNELNQFKMMRKTFDELEYICDFYYDAINDYIYFSSQITDMLQIDPKKEFIPSIKHFLRYVHPDERERVKNTYETALEERKSYQIEYRIVRQDQSTLLIREQGGILFDPKGNVEGLFGFLQDITEHEIPDDVMQKGQQLKELYNNPHVGIWSIDMQNDKTMKASTGIEYITGYTKEDFENGLIWESIVYKADLQQFLANQSPLSEGNIVHHQYRIINKKGDIKWVQDYTIPILDDNGDMVLLHGLITDITQQKELEEKINYLANFDPLTNLPNRNKFNEELEQIIKGYSNSTNQFAVLKLDINGFKYINNTLGNKLGDELLKKFPRRVKSYLSRDDMIARRSSDEFILLIKKIESIDVLKEKIKQIVECLNEPFNIQEYRLYVTASIGVSTYPENGQTSLEIMRNASLALQNAQKEGNEAYHILSQSSSIQSFKDHSLGRDIKNAIDNKELVLYYQPRVDSNSNQIIGAEALIRWNHSEWGLVSPVGFLTIAEENGLITKLDDWVLEEVCNQIRKWKDTNINVVPISINITAANFMKPDWPSKVAATIQEAGIHPQDIEFEITESMILNNTELVTKSISILKELGIKIILDDFGKGYSSLSYLTQYPFDVIKIDKSFIRNMHNDERNMHLIKSIIYMVKGLNLRVVAEGVETINQLKVLQNEYCHEIQGYLFSRPLPMNEFETLLQKKILLPTDPKEKAKHDRRSHSRFKFHDPLEANIKLLSIAGRNIEIGVSKVFVTDISVGGLRFVSNLKLPIRGDVIYQFITELLGEPIKLKGSIVWKEEMNEDLTEYGIKFLCEKEEQAPFTLLNSFIVLSKDSKTLPSYRKVDTLGINEYFM